MIVDTSVIVAILHQEPDWRDFMAILIDADRPLLPAPAYVEVGMVMDGGLPHGASDDRVDRLLDRLGVSLVACDAAIARGARGAFARYGRGRAQPGTAAARLNFGDCLVYATAKHLGLPLLFKGLDFALTDITPALPAGANP